MNSVTKKEFIKLWNKHSIAELTKILSVSRTTIRGWGNKFNLPSKRKKLIKDA